MRAGKGRAGIVASVLFLLVAGLSGACRFGSDSDALTCTVAYVNDGDTVTLGTPDRQSVRYLGIDTLEIDRKRHRPNPLALAARDLNRRLVLQKRVRLEFDRERTDRYGRWLAYVFLEDGTFVNREILVQGLGFCLFKQPNTRRAKEMLEAQRSAMTAGRGIWKGWVETGADYVGNRRSGIFHHPDCPNGRRISPKNRVRFTTRWEAFWAGYAPARSCLGNAVITRR